VLHGRGHLVVQKLSADRWKPVIVDVVKMGGALYPFQFHLAVEYYLRRKFERGFKRFIERFKA
jgi:hypothetical protein